MITFLNRSERKSRLNDLAEEGWDKWTKVHEEIWPTSEVPPLKRRRHGAKKIKEDKEPTFGINTMPTSLVVSVIVHNLSRNSPKTDHAHTIKALSDLFSHNAAISQGFLLGCIAFGVATL